MSRLHMEWSYSYVFLEHIISMEDVLARDVFFISFGMFPQILGMNAT